MRLDYIRANVKTTAGDVKDVTGPVVTPAQIKRAQGGSELYSLPLQWAIYGDGSSFVGDIADPAYACEGVVGGLGTPCGVRAKSQSMIGTPALSIGYFLDEEHAWAVEGFVLAKPIDVTIQGDGPNHLNGQDIIKLKFLPPTVSLSRYFGKKSDFIRPYVGFLGSYGIFYDTQATDYLNAYQGGSKAGDTTIRVKNVLGWGGQIGVSSKVGDDWSLNLSIGKIRYKTDTEITTRNTKINADSLVLQDYGPGAREAINALVTGGNNPPTTFNTVMCKVANIKATGSASSSPCDGTSSGNQGTYVRRASNVLDSTLFVLSVGRSF